MEPMTLQEPISNEEISIIRKVKFEVYGLEMKEKEVKSNGRNQRVSGRVYLPLSWIGHTVKIIKIE